MVAKSMQLDDGETRAPTHEHPEDRCTEAGQAEQPGTARHLEAVGDVRDAEGHHSAVCV